MVPQPATRDISLASGDHSGLLKQGTEKQVNHDGEDTPLIGDRRDIAGGYAMSHAEDAARSLTDE